MRFLRTNPSPRMICKPSLTGRIRKRQRGLRNGSLLGQHGDFRRSLLGWVERKPKMKQKWGRARYAGKWPSRKPWWTIAAALAATVLTALINHWVYERSWTPLQKYYEPLYAQTEDFRTAT